MPSSVDVQRSALLWLVSATPTYTFAPIVIVAEPTEIQFVPSADFYPVNVLPLRTSLTQ